MGSLEKTGKETSHVARANPVIRFKYLMKDLNWYGIFNGKLIHKSASRIEFTVTKLLWYQVEPF